MSEIRSIPFQSWIGLAGLSALAFFAGCNSETSTVNADSEIVTKSEVKPDIKSELKSEFEPEHKREHSVWPNFRGPDFLSTTDMSAPTQWNAEQGIKWIAELPGRGASSPIKFGNRIYLTAYSGYGVDVSEPGDPKDLRQQLLCFDSETSQILWQREMTCTGLLQKMNPELGQHGFASSTPTTDGKRIFAWFGVTGLFAFDVDGTPLWQRNLGLGTHHFGSSGSLVLFENLVIVNASIESKSIYGVDQETGAVVWTIPDIVECWSLPIIATNPSGKHEMIVSSKNTVAAYDPKTGSPLWHCQGIQDYVVSVPIVVDGICYLTGGKEKQMMAIRLGGSGDVEQTHKVWQTKSIGSNVSSLVYHDGLLFSFHDSGIIQIVDAKTGQLKLRRRTGTRTKPFSSPLLMGSKLYMPFADVGVEVFSADEKGESLAVNATPDDAPLQASITPGDDCFWYRNDRCLYCVGPSDSGATRTPWAEPTDKLTVQTRPPYHVEVERGWSRRYLLFMTTNHDEIARYLLMPYQSVITDDQTEQSNVIIADRMPGNMELLKRYKALQLAHLSAPANEDESFDPKYQQLETDLDKYNNETRILIKGLFSPEQMKQHMADAAAGTAAIKPKN